MKVIKFKLTDDEEKFVKKVITASRYKNLIDPKKVYMDAIMRALATF